jgi:hypothetical protein
LIGGHPTINNGCALIEKGRQTHANKFLNQQTPFFQQADHRDQSPRVKAHSTQSISNGPHDLYQRVLTLHRAETMGLKANRRCVVVEGLNRFLVLDALQSREGFHRSNLQEKLNVPIRKNSRKGRRQIVRFCGYRS